MLGIDYGERRVGLALSDPTGTIAQPHSTLVRRRGKRAPVAAVLRIVAEESVDAIVVGLPLSLAGDEGEWAAEVRAFGDKLAERSGKPVDYIDERFTSSAAQRAVRSIGLPRSERARKERVDAAAAALILQAYLDRRERAG